MKRSPVRMALLASRSHRTGPDSRLIRFIREFEPALHHQDACKVIWTTPRIAELVNAADLLVNAPMKPVRAAHDGGLVEITTKVVNGEIDVVIYFMDPRDPTSVYPEATALKRECVTHGVYFLSTYMSAVEWASLAWRGIAASYFAKEKFWTPAGEQRVALIAHDQRKVQMLKFALMDHFELLSLFKERVATGTTGSYLEGTKELADLRREVSRNLALAEQCEDTKALQKLQEDSRLIEELSSPSIPRLAIERKKSGPEGGDVQIANEVNEGKVDKVIFFEDPFTAQPHESDIQLLERTCRLRGERVVCLSDPKSADLWASAWQVDANDTSQGYLRRVPVTLARALENTYGKQRGRRLRVVLTHT